MQLVALVGKLNETEPTLQSRMWLSDAKQSDVPQSTQLLWEVEDNFHYTEASITADWLISQHVSLLLKKAEGAGEEPSKRRICTKCYD